MFYSFQHHCRHLILITAVICLSPNVSAVQSYGHAAIINDNIDAARNRAYNAAVSNAQGVNGVHIRSHSNLISGELQHDHVEVLASSRPLQTRIIDESINDQAISVQVEANDFLLDKNCASQSKYRKKIGLSQVSIEHAKDIGLHDYYGYERGVPADLSYQLSRLNNYLTRDLSHYSVFQNDSRIPATPIDRATERSNMLAMARRYNVQFILTAKIKDLSLVTSTTHDMTPSLIHEYFPQNPYDKRNLSIEFYLFDALNGELLARNQHHTTVKGGDVFPEEAIAYESGKFAQSSLGQAFKKIISKQLEITDSLLACRPFVTNVIQNKEDKVYLDAGADTGIKVGDIFTIYQPDMSHQTFSVDGLAEQFGWEEVQTEILKVFPAYSVGRLNKTVSPNKLLHMRAW